MEKHWESRNGILEEMSAMGKNVIKAVGLLSGGLDSTLAAKIMLEQDIVVYLVNFTSPFNIDLPKNGGASAVTKAVKELGNIPLKRIPFEDDYLEMVCNPMHGYGKGMNPCIDCRIMSIRKAGEYMRQIKASFLFTGEVLGQRPMSQHRKAVEIIDRETGLKELILRPLSALHFKPTIPEKEGWVDRSRLFGISGRSRKAQISLAAVKGIKEYPSPAGGCLLTDKNFSDRLRDYLMFTKTPSMEDIPLLKVGRHFRLETGDKVIVARDEHECKILKILHREKDHLFEPLGFSGPVVILQGDMVRAAIDKMMRYTKKPLDENSLVSHRRMGKERIISLHGIA